MSRTPLPTPLRGIVPPMITPLKDGDTLDVDGLERLVEHLISGGVHGLFILGSSGEASSLSCRLRREVIARTCKQVGGRLPVLVGVSDTSIVETVDLAGCAADAGATAVVAAPPYYFSLTQPELIHYVRTLVSELPLPVLLYNIPALTKTSFEPETVRLLLDVPQIVGLKDSSRQLDYFVTVREVTRQRPDWSLLVGFEHLLVDTIRAGGNGGVCAGANLSPRLLVELYEAAAADQAERIEQLERSLARQRGIYTVGDGAAASIRGIKCALSLRGICEDRMAEPFQPLSTEERGRVEAILSGCDWRTDS